MSFSYTNILSRHWNKKFKHTPSEHLTRGGDYRKVGSSFSGRRSLKQATSVYTLLWIRSHRAQKPFFLKKKKRSNPFFLPLWLCVLFYFTILTPCMAISCLAGKHCCGIQSQIPPNISHSPDRAASCLRTHQDSHNSEFHSAGAKRRFYYSTKINPERN